jgi:hypothetical protein
MTFEDLARQEKDGIDAGDPAPVLVLRPSFVARTGQDVRLRTAYAATMLGSAALIGGFVTMRRHFGMTLLLGGMALSIAGFVALCRAVRCPRCRVAVVWHTLNTRDHGAAMLAAFYQLACPKCGYDPL